MAWQVDVECEVLLTGTSGVLLVNTRQGLMCNERGHIFDPPGPEKKPASGAPRQRSVGQTGLVKGACGDPIKILHRQRAVERPVCCQQLPQPSPWLAFRILPERMDETN